MSTQHSPANRTDTQTLGTISNGDSLTIQNIHAAGTLGTEIDLEQLAPALNNAQDLSKERGFLGSDYEIETNNTIKTGRIQLWRTGRYTITAINTISQLELIEQQFLSELEDLGVPLTNTEPAQITNFIVTLTLTDTNRLNLNAVAIGLGLEHTEYEPDQFPGLRYSRPDDDAVCMIFGSGKINIVGAKTQEDVRETAEHVQSRLLELNLI